MIHVHDMYPGCHIVTHMTSCLVACCTYRCTAASCQARLPASQYLTDTDTARAKLVHPSCIIENMHHEDWRLKRCGVSGLWLCNMQHDARVLYGLCVNWIWNLGMDCARAEAK